MEEKKELCFCGVLAYTDMYRVQLLTFQNPRTGLEAVFYSFLFSSFIHRPARTRHEFRAEA